MVAAWNMSFSVTLEQEPETVDQAALRREMAVLYGVPLSYIQLSINSGSAIILVTIAPPKAAPIADVAMPADNATATAPGLPSQVGPPALLLLTEADIQLRVDALDDIALTSALNITARRTSNVTIMLTGGNITVTTTVRVEKELVCSPGYWCATGRALPCAAGYMAENSSSSFCDACPSGSFQNSTGQTKCHDCVRGTSHLLSTPLHSTPRPIYTRPTMTPCRYLRVALVAGNYCLEGSSLPLPCPSGRFSGSTGLGTANQCTLCPSGTAASAC